MDMTIKLTVNGVDRTVTTDPQRSLLEVLREDLGLTGPKYGCGEGLCGACSVLVNGQSVRSCITRISEVNNKQVVTVEGLSQGDTLHPVQQAFVDEGAVQCGYCTGGMIVSAVALLEHNSSPKDAEIVHGMNGHICRCNGYPKIVSAVSRAAKEMKR
jgi:aerobic-type carbon monoxide dehydrogenase small subunit (CoxS/CutS family)